MNSSGHNIYNVEEMGRAVNSAAQSEKLSGARPTQTFCEKSRGEVRQLHLYIAYKEEKFYITPADAN